MSSRFGSIALPAPNSTSDLVNDSRFLSIHDYVLNLSVLSGGSTLTITDLPQGAIIIRVDIRVTTAFTTVPDVQHNIEITNSNGSVVLMDNEWNDPNVVGSYSTECYHVVSGNLKVTHDLASMQTRSAILRFHLYEMTN